jgi:hypothetical protein
MEESPVITASPPEPPPAVPDSVAISEFLHQAAAANLSSSPATEATTDREPHRGEGLSRFSVEDSVAAVPDGIERLDSDAGPPILGAGPVSTLRAGRSASMIVESTNDSLLREDSGPSIEERPRSETESQMPPPAPPDIPRSMSQSSKPPLGRKSIFAGISGLFGRREGEAPALPQGIQEEDDEELDMEERVQRLSERLRQSVALQQRAEAQSVSLRETVSTVSSLLLAAASLVAPSADEDGASVAGSTGGAHVPTVDEARAATKALVDRRVQSGRPRGVSFAASLFGQSDDKADLVDVKVLEDESRCAKAALKVIQCLESMETALVEAKVRFAEHSFEKDTAVAESNRRRIDDVAAITKRLVEAESRASAAEANAKDLRQSVEALRMENSALRVDVARLRMEVQRSVAGSSSPLAAAPSVEGAPDGGTVRSWGMQSPQMAPSDAVSRADSVRSTAMSEVLAGTSGDILEAAEAIRSKESSRGHRASLTMAPNAPMLDPPPAPRLEEHRPGVLSVATDDSLNVASPLGTFVSGGTPATSTAFELPEMPRTADVSWKLPLSTSSTPLSDKALIASRSFRMPGRPPSNGGESPDSDAKGSSSRDIPTIHESSATMALLDHAKPSSQRESDAMTIVHSAVESVPLFRKLFPQEKALLKSSLRHMRFTDTDVLCRPGGAAADTFFIVVSGVVSLLEPLDVEVGGTPGRRICPGEWFVGSTIGRRTAVARGDVVVAMLPDGSLEQLLQWFAESRRLSAPKPSTPSTPRTPGVASSSIAATMAATRLVKKLSMRRRQRAIEAEDQRRAEEGSARLAGLRHAIEGVSTVPAYLAVVKGILGSGTPFSVGLELGRFALESHAVQAALSTYALAVTAASEFETAFEASRKAASDVSRSESNRLISLQAGAKAALKAAAAAAKNARSQAWSLGFADLGQAMRDLQREESVIVNGERVHLRSASAVAALVWLLSAVVGAEPVTLSEEDETDAMLRKHRDRVTASLERLGASSLGRALGSTGVKRGDGVARVVADILVSASRTWSGADAFSKVTEALMRPGLVHVAAEAAGSAECEISISGDNTVRIVSTNSFRLIGMSPPAAAVASGVAGDLAGTRQGFVGAAPGTVALVRTILEEKLEYVSSDEVARGVSVPESMRVVLAKQVPVLPPSDDSSNPFVESMSTTFASVGSRTMEEADSHQPKATAAVHKRGRSHTEVADEFELVDLSDGESDSQSLLPDNSPDSGVRGHRPRETGFGTRVARMFGFSAKRPDDLAFLTGEAMRTGNWESALGSGGEEPVEEIDEEDEDDLGRTLAAVIERTSGGTVAGLIRGAANPPVSACRVMRTLTISVIESEQ